MPERKLWAMVLGLSLLFSGCSRLATTREYTPPARGQHGREYIERDYPYPAELVWHSLVESLGLLPVNSIHVDKPSSVIRVELYTESPDDYIDCGRYTYIIQRRRGLPPFRSTSPYSEHIVNIADGEADYDTGESRKKRSFQQRSTLTISTTIKLNPITSTSTNVSVMSTYTLLIVDYLKTRNNYVEFRKKTYTISQRGNLGDTKDLACVSLDNEANLILDNVHRLIQTNFSRVSK